MWNSGAKRLIILHKPDQFKVHVPSVFKDETGITKLKKKYK